MVQALKALSLKAPLMTSSDIERYVDIRNQAKLRFEALKRDMLRTSPSQRYMFAADMDSASRAYDGICKVLRDAMPAKEVTDISVVDIDLVVTGQHFDDNDDPVGVPMTFVIGGHGSSDLRASPPVLSYDSRQVLHMLGHKVGDYCTSMVGSKRTEFRIDSIRRMSDPPVDVQSIGQDLGGAESVAA